MSALFRWAGCRLLLYPDMMYGYYPERLPVTREAAEKRKGVRVEIGGMMRYISHHQLSCPVFTVKICVSIRCNVAAQEAPDSAYQHLRSDLASNYMWVQY